VPGLVPAGMITSASSLSYKSTIYQQDNIQFVEQSIEYFKTIPNNFFIPEYSVDNSQVNCFNSNNILIVAGTGEIVDINSGGEATFISGGRIYLKPGFHGHEGSHGHAYITSTGEYCSQLVPMVAIQSPPHEEADVLQELFVDEDVGVKIYPNPTLDRFTIDFLGKKPNADIMLLNFQGQVALTSQSNELTLKEIDIGHFPEGMYIILIKTQDQIIKKKIIKKY